MIKSLKFWAQNNSYWPAMKFFTLWATMRSTVRSAVKQFCTAGCAFSAQPVAAARAGGPHFWTTSQPVFEDKNPKLDDPFWDL